MARRHVQKHVAARQQADMDSTSYRGDAVGMSVRDVS
jgi:hypothetical protein